MTDHTPDDRDAGAVAKLLAPLSAHRPELSADRQRALWLSIEARRTAQLPQWLWALVGLVAAATTAGIIFLWPHGPNHQPPPIPERVLAQGAMTTTGGHLPSGAKLRVQDGQALLALATADHTLVVLKRGAALSEVPHLKAGQTFEVETALAQVAVRGTRFWVRHLHDGATEVRVKEGRVEVTPKDGRPAFMVQTGQVKRLNPLTFEGGTAALEQRDYVGAAQIFAHRLASQEDSLPVRNAHLRLGKSLLEASPEAAAILFDALKRRFPSGWHADEYAFRHAQALKQAGRTAEASAAAADLRETFPKSPRAAETTRW